VGILFILVTLALIATVPLDLFFLLISVILVGFAFSVYACVLLLWLRIDFICILIGHLGPKKRKL
jgi:hypothetical protein